MTTQNQWARVLTAASEYRHPDPVPDALLRSAVALGLDVAPDAVGCSITQLHGAEFNTPFASDELAMALDLAQYTAGTGPCVTAARNRQLQRVDDVTADSRFLAWAEVATARGVRSSLSVPLMSTDRPSAVNLYASTPEAFANGRSRAVATLLARCISTLLPQEAAPATSADDAALASARRDGRAVTEATEQLMRRDGTARSVAFDRLIRSAADSGRHVVDVAHELLSEDEVTA